LKSRGVGRGPSTPLRSALDDRRGLGVGGRGPSTSLRSARDDRRGGWGECGRGPSTPLRSALDDRRGLGVGGRGPSTPLRSARDDRRGGLGVEGKLELERRRRPVPAGSPPHKLQTRRIDAVAQAGGLGAVGKYVALVPAATGAMNLGPAHVQREVELLFQNVP
jgi:hypothetical protein